MIVFIFLLIAVFFFINVMYKMNTRIWFIPFMLLRYRSRKTLLKMVNPNIVVKVDDGWRATDFGDYKTSWKLIDKEKRIYHNINLCFNKAGKITHIDSSDSRTLTKVCSNSVILNLKDYMA